MIKLLILTLLFFFFGVGPAFAVDPPIQLSPSNNSTVTSSKLEWQIPPYPLYTGGSYYMVQVDDQQDFTNPEKNNIYLTNNYYTPKLNPGTWYWRVKAKDSAGIWSNWSEGWSFNLNAATSTSSPTPSPSSAPTPTPSSTPSPTSQTSTSSFTISNIPSQISSDQSFTVSVSLSLPSSPNTTFYLKGAFKKADGSNYFGLTKVAGNWVKNGSSFANQYVITTDSSGNWSGNLEVQPDTEDSGFTGSGDYIFKVARYTSTGSGPTWSNEFMMNIVSTESSDQGSTVLSTTSNNSSSTTNPSPSLSVKGKTTISSQSKSYDKQSLPSREGRLVYHTASVAAATASATPSATTKVKSQKQVNYFNWVGVLMILTGTLVLAFVYLRGSNLRETVFNLFRKRN